MRRFSSTYAAFCCWLVFLTACAHGAYAQDSEDINVKAAYIYNFTKFVEWPGDKATSAHSKLDICVVGESDMMRTADVFKKASTPQRQIVLVEENSISQVTSHCHIAFIGESEASHLNEILAALKGQPVLTVSDIDNFAERGGMIGFVVTDNKIKLTANTRPVAAAGLRIDAQLLEIALKVIDR